MRINKKRALFLICLTIIAAIYYWARRDIYQPLHRLPPKNVPFFSDDTDHQSLLNCARRQLTFLQRQDPLKTAYFGKDRYSYAQLCTSISKFIAKLEEHPDPAELNRFLHKNYTVYQAGGRKGKRNRQMLVTGYYEPVFAGSLVKKEPFLTPIYSRPKSLINKNNNDKGGCLVGRYNEDNTFVPYWSRAEIEGKNLLKGYELAYLRDPFDAYLLHVQGSGRIELPDHSLKTIRYAASNGLEYKSIGKVLVDEKIMPLAEVNIPSIRAYLRQHPEQQQRLFHHNPRYIFFRWGDDSGPVGSSGEILTPGRSIALDGNALPVGAIGYLISRQPSVKSTATQADNKVTDWHPLTRFVFAQDSGSAIRGTGRVDLFWGMGEYARAAANHMKEPGKLFFLVKKKSTEYGQKKSKPNRKSQKNGLESDKRQGCFFPPSKENLCQKSGNDLATHPSPKILTPPILKPATAMLIAILWSS